VFYMYSMNLGLSVFPISLLDIFTFMCAYVGVILCLRWPLSIHLVHDAQQDVENKQRVLVLK
jgi:hypothetical protein